MSGYRKDGRLNDVLAMIQVLCLGENIYRSTDGLLKELEGPPQSAPSWLEIAEQHREFFRVSRHKKYPISLVVRHITADSDGKGPWLAADYTEKLLGLAVELHDREERRAQRWQIYVPVIAAFIAFCGAMANWYSVLHSPPTSPASVSRQPYSNSSKTS